MCEYGDANRNGGPCARPFSRACAREDRACRSAPRTAITKAETESRLRAIARFLEDRQPCWKQGRARCPAGRPRLRRPEAGQTPGGEGAGRTNEGRPYCGPLATPLAQLIQSVDLHRACRHTSHPLLTCRRSTRPEWRRCGLRKSRKATARGSAEDDREAARQLAAPRLLGSPPHSKLCSEEGCDASPPRRLRFEHLDRGLAV